MDLILLAKIMKMEADIRTAPVELDAASTTVEEHARNPNIKPADLCERYPGAAAACCDPI